MASAADQLTLNDASKKAIHIAQAIAKENMNGQFNAAHLIKALLHKDVGLLPTLKNLIIGAARAARATFFEDEALPTERQR